MQKKTPSAIEQKNKRLALILMFGVLCMFGFCYLLVPIFTFVCKQIGFNGKTASSPSAMASGMQIDKSRTIRVDLTTFIHGGLDFRFIPLIKHLDIHPGEGKLIYFYAENKSGSGMIVQAVPSVTPPDGARFLKKTECFCFTQQHFNKDEKADMPVYFFIDPSVPASVKEMTLSYTLFDASGYEKKQTEYRKGRIDI